MFRKSQKELVSKLSIDQVSQVEERRACLCASGVERMVDNLYRRPLPCLLTPLFCISRSFWPYILVYLTLSKFFLSAFSAGMQPNLVGTMRKAVVEERPCSTGNSAWNGNEEFCYFKPQHHSCIASCRIEEDCQMSLHFVIERLHREANIGGQTWIRVDDCKGQKLNALFLQENTDIHSESPRIGINLLNDSYTGEEIEYFQVISIRSSIF